MSLTRTHPGKGRHEQILIGTQQPEHVQLGDDAANDAAVIDDGKRVEVMAIEQGNQVADRRLRRVVSSLNLATITRGKR